MKDSVQLFMQNYADSSVVTGESDTRIRSIMTICPFPNLCLNNPLLYYLDSPVRKSVVIHGQTNEHRHKELLRELCKKSGLPWARHILFQSPPTHPLNCTPEPLSHAEYENVFKSMEMPQTQRKSEKGVKIGSANSKVRDEEDEDDTSSGCAPKIIALYDEFKIFHISIFVLLIPVERNRMALRSPRPWKREEGLRKEDLSLVIEDWIRDLFSRFNINKFMGTDGMHPWVLRELADVVALLLYIIFEKSWRIGEMPDDWRKATFAPMSKRGKNEDPGNDGPISLTSIPEKVWNVLEVVTKHVKEKNVIRSSQYELTKGKSCLTNVIAYYDEMAKWVNEGRAVNIIYLDFS
ncbi:hypothetical protein WISP_72752 [Willisornis vidua]|uniref:Uncharacterized protein n=1 Tax=Willisornis vidua TaxID=1566151 RepID=A0ABQ9DD05_9PASS|nr:hypothetical protein WISP_72752 [Willisornis vidua]